MGYLNQVNSWVWGPILVSILVGTGLYFTIILRGIQFRSLWRGLRYSVSPSEGEGDVSPFKALTTAIAGAVGTGNVAGVALAISIGGVGSIFWMWVSGLLGMAITYAEALLAVRYRVTNEQGRQAGGPMYYIDQGLGWKWMAVFYAIFGVIASFGIGNLVQANAIGDVMGELFGLPRMITGVILVVLVGLIVIKGIRGIGAVTSWVVPIMVVAYVVAGIAVLCVEYQAIPGAIGLIFKSAFTGQAGVGGFVGASSMLAVRMGMSRGVFSNESGLGSNSIAAAAAITDQPARQGLIAMCGTFIDTIIVCSVTGLVIAVTQVLGTTDAEGALLTAFAFGSALPGGGYVVAVGLVCFAFTTILAWTYYGEKCLEYLAGTRVSIAYRMLFCFLLLFGAVLPMEFVWGFSDLANGLMAFPNLFALLFLSGVVVAETKLLKIAPTP